MTWIITASGRRIDLAAPHFTDVDGYDIAWALAQTNRFSGHALRPYSVAEHSLLVADLAEAAGLDVHGQLAALLHDAHEAYCGDVSTPAKAAIGPAWGHFERELEVAVKNAFGIHAAAAVHHHLIKHFDLVALATEKRDLVAQHGAGRTPWPMLEGIEPAAGVNLRSAERAAMGWEDWRDAFLDRLHSLEFQRAERLTAMPA